MLIELGINVEPKQVLYWNNIYPHSLLQTNFVEPKQVLYWNAINLRANCKANQVEPKQVLYWNPSCEATLVRLGRVEPKQVLYWNEATGSLPESSLSRTETSVVLKFSINCISYFKNLSRTETSVVLKLCLFGIFPSFIQSNRNKCCIEIDTGCRYTSSYRCRTETSVVLKSIPF